MKMLVKSILVLSAVVLFAFRPETVQAKKISFDEWATDSRGGRHHIHGWIDVGFFPPRINHWDVYYDDTHFTGLIRNPNLDHTPTAFEIEDVYEMETFDEFGMEVPYETIDFIAAYDKMEEIRLINNRE